MNTTMNTKELIVKPQRRQKIEGFGASGAWWAQMVGQHQEARETVLDLLFHPQIGIGLSVYRHNLGGGHSQSKDTWRRAETLEVAAGFYDWSRDKAATKCLQGAVARGVKDVVLFANSPAARMTISGQASGHLDGVCNLPVENRLDFVRYLVDIAQYFLKALDLPAVFLSPINEPQWNWNPEKGQEGCFYTPSECAEVAQLLLEELERRGENRILLSLIDSATWEVAPTYLEALLEFSKIKAKMPHFSVHSYFNDTAQKTKALEHLLEIAPDMPLWMSEWTQMEAGRDESIESALVLAQTVHEDLTLCNVTSWQAWIAVSPYDYHDGLIYVDQTGQHPVPTKRLWAFGQFAKFVRPNAVRLELEAPATVQASAYLSNDEQSLHVVVINPGDQAQDLQIQMLEDFRDSSASLTVTDSQHNLEQIWADKIDNQVAITFPAKSVSTLAFVRSQ